MNIISQEIVIAYRDESGDLTAVVSQNGHATFYKTKKMNKDDTAELLMEGNEIKK